MTSLYQSSKSINHTLYQLIENQKFAEAKELIDCTIIKISSEETKFRGKEIRGFISLVIRE